MIKKTKLLFCISVLGLIWGMNSLAKDSEKSSTSMMSQEQRLKMAEMHEKMAVCLRSDKPMSECKSEMMSSCKDDCPMMKDMMKHHHKKDHKEETEE